MLRLLVVLAPHLYTILLETQGDPHLQVPEQPLALSMYSVSGYIIGL